MPQSPARQDLRDPAADGQQEGAWVMTGAVSLCCAPEQGRTLGIDVASKHEVHDEEDRAQGGGQHHIARERSKHAEHGHSVLMHQEEDGVEHEEPAAPMPVHHPVPPFTFPPDSRP
jgi:hypothetical protein